MIKWLIENYDNSQSIRDLATAVTKTGNILLQYPFNYNQIRQSKTPVIFYGSITTERTVNSMLKDYVQPISYADYENYRCINYYQYYEELLLNDNHCFVSLKSLKRDYFEIFQDYGIEAKIFIRPDAGDKPFGGFLLDLMDFDRWVTSDFCGKDDDMLVISSPKKIIWEGRFLCSKNGIIAHSTYMFQDQKTFIPSVPEGTKEFCLKVLERGYYPDPCFTVDICQTDKKEFKLLELNSFSTAGLYAVDKEKVVLGVNEVILNEKSKQKAYRDS